MIKSRKNTIIGIMRRECLRFLRDPFQTIFNTVFYNFIFLITLSFLSPSKLNYIIPGMIIYTSFNIILSNVKMSLFIGKIEKVIYYQLAAPISRIELFFIYQLASIIRSSIVNSLILILIRIVYPNGKIFNYHYFIICFIVINILFVNISILITLFYKNWNSVGVAENYIISPLLFMSGSFFSIINIPELLKNFILINPFFYIVNLLRYTYEGSLEGSLQLSLYVLIIFLFCSTVLCMYFFKVGFKLLK